MNKVFLSSCCVAVAFSQYSLADVAKIGAVVMDAEDDAPLGGVAVEAVFSNSNGWKAWTETAASNVDHRKTDKDGRCHLSGETNTGRAGCWVSSPPQGYYSAGGRSFRFKEKDASGVWQPDNLVATIRLQRVERPIPLFVKKVSKVDWKRPVGGFDGTNAVMRYDFVNGDWLPPDGKGEVADLVVSARLVSRSADDEGKPYQRVFYVFEYGIEFPGEGNGFFQKLVPPTAGIRLRAAEEGGSVRRKVIRQGRRREAVGDNSFAKEFSEADPNRCYCFRIRTVRDEKGRLKEAFYGKIYGDFKFTDRKAVFRGVEFLYYLNPRPLDRNLEWDMKNNLCPNPGNIGERRP